MNHRLANFASLFLMMVLVPASQGQVPAGAAYPREVAGWTPETKEQQRVAGQGVAARIAESVAKGEKEIVIPKGDYRFNAVKGAHLPLSNLHDVTLDFQGSTLWFETNITGVWLTGCRNVTLRNVILDWDPLPFFQGIVTAISDADDTFDLRIDPGYEPAALEMAKQATAANWRGIVFSNGELKPGQHAFGVDFSPDHRNADGSYRIKFHGFYGVHIAQSGVALGDPMVVLARMGRAFKVDGSDNCVLEDVTLYSSPFVAFNTNLASGLVFRRCHILRRPGTNRLLAGNADGINCSNMRRGPLIEDCSMETIGDDFVNIHGFYSRVLSQESPDQIIVSRIAYQNTLTEPITLEFFDRTTMTPLGTRRATAQGLSWTVDRNRCLADLSYKWHSGESSGLDYGKTVPAQRLTLDSPLELKGDVIVSCEEFSGPGTVIRNCDFKGSLARGIRLQSPHTLIENNRLSIMAGSALTMVGQGTFWGEGTYVHSTVVRGNTFADSSIFSDPSKERVALLIQEGDNFQACHLPHDIRIENNTFLHSAGLAIVARGVDRLTVTGNQIDGYGLFPQPPPGGPREPLKGAIQLESCNDVVLNGNKTVNPGPYGGGDAVNTAGVTMQK